MIYNLLFTIVLVAIDQGLKYLATLYLSSTAPVTIIPGVFGLNYVLNTGSAWSMFSGKTDMLIIITSIALLIMSYFLFLKPLKNKFELLCFLLIFAGGVGNLIDRIAAGKVIDYLEFLFIEFPIFNFADILVCFGVGMYAVYTIYTEFKKPKVKDNA